MKKILLAIAILTSGITFAQGQFEQGMNKAFALWKEGKNTEASAMFERIASAEKDNWLPNYYVAMVNTTASFGTKDKETVSALLNKAQNALDIIMVKNPENAEILIMQALIYTGWVAFDPMTNGMALSGKVMEMYASALKLEPENPRAVFGKAEYEMGGAKFFGTDIKPMCAEVERSVKLFEKFKPAMPYAPDWGKERAVATLAECNKK